ncbi:MAG TPA: ATP-binding cassette domain-containing protein, partial [Oceanipulchritudo sp.]|nr:ATP-binding cassette domain-containing protein [Oceanipulchritudo sp.]
MLEHASSDVSGGITPLLQCDQLHLGYPVAHSWKPVVHGVSFSIARGETFALVGESGSGKSTIAKALVKLIPVRSGSIRIDGEEVGPLSAKAFKPHRKRIQLVFQDPWQALNPRLTAGDLLREALELHFPSLSNSECSVRIASLLESVHLPVSL